MGSDRSEMMSEDATVVGTDNAKVSQFRMSKQRWDMVVASALSWLVGYGGVKTVCMILPGGGSRLQTLGRLAA